MSRIFFAPPKPSKFWVYPTKGIMAARNVSPTARVQQPKIQQLQQHHRSSSREYG